jgi:hypothetical protein
VDGLELPIIDRARQTLRDERLKSVILELSLSRHAERQKGFRLMEEAGLQFVSHGESQGAT